MTQRHKNSWSHYRDGDLPTGTAGILVGTLHTGSGNRRSDALELSFEMISVQTASSTIAVKEMFLYDPRVFSIARIHEKACQLNLDFLVIGGHAVNVYCEPRATLDVDFLVCRDHLSSWSDLLTAEGFCVDHLGPTFVHFNPPYGVDWRLDLMLVSADTFRKLRESAQSHLMLGIQSLVPRPEHLIALKVHALKYGHQERFEKDFIDVIALTRNAGLDPRSAIYRQIFEQFGTQELYEKVLHRLGR